MQYLKLVTNCRNVQVWGRTPTHVNEFKEEMTKDGWIVQSASTINDLLYSCELIITTTSSRNPLLGIDLDEKQIKKGGQHITCIGADATGKIELDPILVAKADLLVADSRLQTEERGEFELAISKEMIKLNEVVELGELIESVDLHRGEDDRLTIFDSSGVAVQDCVVAKMVFDTLK